MDKIVHYSIVDLEEHVLNNWENTIPKENIDLDEDVLERFIKDKDLLLEYLLYTFPDDILSSYMSTNNRHLYYEYLNKIGTEAKRKDIILLQLDKSAGVKEVLCFYSRTNVMAFILDFLLFINSILNTARPSHLKTRSSSTTLFTIYTLKENLDRVIEDTFNFSEGILETKTYSLGGEYVSVLVSTYNNTIDLNKLPASFPKEKIMTGPNHIDLDKFSKITGLKNIEKITI